MKIKTEIEVTPEEAATFFKEISPAKDADKFAEVAIKSWFDYCNNMQTKFVQGEFPFYKTEKQ